MIVCLDTNVLVQARSKRHPWSVLLRSLAFGRMSWAVSNTVLTEYKEIIGAKCGAAAWEDMSRFIDLIAVSGNLITIQPHYQFRVIGADPDDNAFTDCSEALFFIANQAHSMSITQLPAHQPFGGMPPPITAP